MVLASNAIWHISLKMHFACMHGTDFGQTCNAFLKIIALTMHFWGKINLNFDFYHALFWFCQKFSYHACILHAKFPLPCILHVCNYALHVCNAFNARTMFWKLALNLWKFPKIEFTWNSLKFTQNALQFTWNLLLLKLHPKFTQISSKSTKMGGGSIP